MKRLFQVKQGPASVIRYAGDSPYFESKEEAKKLRDLVNSGNPTGPRAHVTFGPDHKRYPGGARA